MSCGLSGPTSPLAFAGAALGAIGQSAASLQNKEQLWRMWSTVVNPLTDTITQVGKCVTLFLTHYRLNRVKGFCEEIFRGSCEAQNKYKVLQIHSVTLQSNEVNQGDALEHNFSAIHAALMFPLTHLLGAALPQVCLLYCAFYYRLIWLF